MDYELIKNEFIKLKKEELDYIEQVSKISRTQILSESLKLEIYRRIKKYESELHEIITQIRMEVSKITTLENRNDIAIKFDVDKNYLSSLTMSPNYYRNYLFTKLGINIKTYQFVLTIKDLLYYREYPSFSIDFIQNNQKLIEKPIYIFLGYSDSSEDCCGPCFGTLEDFIYGRYIDIYDNDIRIIEVSKKEIKDFEKDKTVLYSTSSVNCFEIRKIFEDELLNIQNKTIDDCVVATKKRMEELNYVRSSRYKKKVLLDKINELYESIKGKMIQKEVLYHDCFLEILKETYQLQDGRMVDEERVIKNGGKNSLVVIAITEDKNYLITFQNRLVDEKIAEFLSGTIENEEDSIEAAKRILQEETGYKSDHLFVVDEVVSSPLIDSSTTTIVIAEDCVQMDEKEFVNYGLFTENELEYLVNKNIMKGAMNKLAYYHLIHPMDDCYKKIYKRERKNKILGP